MLHGMDWEVESLCEKDNPFLFYSQESLRLQESLKESSPLASLGVEPLVEHAVESLDQKVQCKDQTLGTDQTLGREKDHKEMVKMEFADSEISRFDIYQLPFLIKTYISSIASILLFLFALYLISTLFWTVRNDLSLKSHEMYLDLMQEIKDCTNNYQINACHLDLPAIKELCLEWKSCMTKPLEVKRLKITLGYIIEVLNSSLESISTRTIVLMAIISVLRLF